MQALLKTIAIATLVIATFAQHADAKYFGTTTAPRQAASGSSR